MSGVLKDVQEFREGEDSRQITSEGSVKCPPGPEAVEPQMVATLWQETEWRAEQDLE